MYYDMENLFKLNDMEKYDHYEIAKAVTNIFVAAKEKGLKDVSIRIYDNSKYVLYVGEKDRFECDNISELLQAISEHEENLSWMNEIKIMELIKKLKSFYYPIALPGIDTILKSKKINEIIKAVNELIVERNKDY